MMKFLLRTRKTLILIGMILLLLGLRSKTVEITPGQPVVSETPYSTRSDVKIKVYNFQDARLGKLDPYLIGKKRAFGVTMVDFYSKRPVFKVVTQAVKSEFIRHGYKIVQQNEDFSVKGRIDHFWAKTPLTRMGATWDVVGEVSLTMEVSRPGQKIGKRLGPYTGRKAKSALSPGPKMFQRVMTDALMEAMQAMSSDPSLTNELSKKQKK
jgi:hypothetical protein